MSQRIIESSGHDVHEMGRLIKASMLCEHRNAARSGPKASRPRVSDWSCAGARGWRDRTREIARNRRRAYEGESCARSCRAKRELGVGQVPRAGAVDSE